MNHDELNDVDDSNRALSAAPDEHLFDLLVDGELSLPEQRELFARLDARPEAWRRCALAFIEAQAWRNDLGPLMPQGSLTLQENSARETTSAAEVSSVEAAADPRAACRAGEASASVPERPAAQVAGAFRLPRWTQNALTLAAGLLCAVLLTLEVRRMVSPSAPSVEAARRDPATAEGNAMPSVATRPQPPGEQATLVSQNDLVGQLKLGEAADTIEVPVFRGPDVERWVREQPSAIPPELRRALEQLGRQVQVERDFVPLDLPDGRQVIVPVERVEVRPKPRFQ